MVNPAVALGKVTLVVNVGFTTHVKLGTVVHSGATISIDLHISLLHSGS